MNSLLLKEKILNGDVVTRDEALEILQCDQPMELFSAANAIREHYFGKRINLCSITNAKSGRCSEDCHFCAQSGHYSTNVAAYPLKSADTLIQEAVTAKTDNHATRFGIVTSGKSTFSDQEMQTIFDACGRYPEAIERCVSLGTLTADQCVKLKNAGVVRLHHNIETAKSFYPKICTTHLYEERIATLENARKAGLELCCGGIVGLGETLEQRVEFAFELNAIAPEDIPLNFLNPIPGTPLEHQPVLAPLDALKTIAMFRFVHPDKTIRIGGGREKALRDLQPLMFLAGANALLTGNYLTTAGKNPQADQQMILDLGLEFN